MAKFYTLLAVVALTLAVVSAEPPRYLTSRRNGALRTNIRFLERQEEAPVEASPAPYPAAGVTPEVPFDLPTETEAPAPDQTYGPPDQTYGPPDQTYGPPEEESAAQPDNTYGPPKEQAPAIEEPAPVEEELPQDLVSQNLIQPRHKAIRSRVRSAALRSRSPAPRASVVEIIRSEPVLVYTLQ